jgi:hypothetical protein
MLNPLISSLSPSKRSKGARFLSIKDKISQIILHLKSNSKLKLLSLFIEKELVNSKMHINIKMRATSNDKFCKIPRRLPSFENLLELLQPVKITAYALTPKTEKKIKLEYFIE